MTLDDYLLRWAERPDDLALKAVFSDWLLERGDSRGEALALELRGEQRKLAALRRLHEAEWLGALAADLELPRCELYGGFPLTLAFKRGAKLPALPPTVRNLSADWRALPALASASARLPALDSLEVVVGLGMAFSDFRALADELDAVAFLKAPHLKLVLDSFLGREAADFLAEGFLRSALCARPRVTLVVRDGSLDAASAWLHWASGWGGGDAWGARWGGADVHCSRDDDGHFRHAEIDLDFSDDKPLIARAASAAAVLSQLGRVGLTRVDVRVPDGVRVGKKLRETLQAPRRFLPSLRGSIRVARKK
jgi:uncharacterized protein (TIGR02996 family)